MDMKYYPAKFKPEQVLAAFARDVSVAGTTLATKLGREQENRGFTAYPFWAVIQGISGKWLFAGRMVLYEDNWAVSFQVFQGGRQRPPTGTPVDIRKVFEAGNKMANKQALLKELNGLVKVARSVLAEDTP